MTPGLCKAEIVVCAASGEQLFALETAWQKEAADAEGEPNGLRLGA